MVFALDEFSQPVIPSASKMLPPILHYMVVFVSGGGFLFSYEEIQCKVEVSYQSTILAEHAMAVY